MASHYHDPGDRMFARQLRRSAGPEFDAFTKFNDVVATRADGALSPKIRELISVAVALTTQCAYCIETHATAAFKQGATEAEMAETVYVAAALRAGGAVAHGRMAMKFFDQASAAAANAEAAR
jgi:AhpD family alkylhydroperoxidase